MNNVKTCIYCLDTYHLLTELKKEYIGGAEVQASLLGKEISKQKGFEVSFVVFDNGQQDHEIVNGIHIFKTTPRMYLLENRGFVPLLRTILINWKVLKQINADVYYSRGSGKYNGIIAIFCYLYRKRFVLGMGSDKDVNGSFERDANLYEIISYRVAIKLADHVISQTQLQKELLKKRFKKSSIQINNMIHISSHDVIKANPPIVIWVGTIRSKWKQPEIFVDLAREIPDAKFQMIGGPSTDPRDIELYEKIKRLATEIPNLHLVGFVPHNEVKKYFDEASILVNTSSVEGFSNTFIEAWMRYTPVVSLNVDPDGMICKNKLGFYSRNFNQLVKDVRTLIDNEELRNKYGNNARKYSETEFDITKIIMQYTELFEKN